MWIVRFVLSFHTFYVLATSSFFLASPRSSACRPTFFPDQHPGGLRDRPYTGLSTPEMEQRITTYAEYSISSNVNGIKDMEAYMS